MTKAKFIAQLAQETGLTKAGAGQVMDAALEIITHTLKKEGRFPFSGLGIFEVVKRPKRKARNPRTGEPVVVKAHKAVKFKPAKALKDTIK